MKIKNPNASSILISDIPGYPGGLLIGAKQEVVLTDEHAEDSADLNRLIQSGMLQKTGDEEPTTLDPMTKVIARYLASDVAIQFADPVNGDIVNEYSGTHGTPVSVRIVITNGVGVVDPFNSISTVVVTATGGTIDGVSSKTVQMAEGIATIAVVRATTGDVTLALSGGNTSLNLADTAVVAFA